MQSLRMNKGQENFKRILKIFGIFYYAKLYFNYMESYYNKNEFFSFLKDIS